MPKKNQPPAFKNECHRIFRDYLDTHGRAEVLDSVRISLTTLIALRDWKFEWSSDPAKATNRQKLAWAKTAARLALYTNKEPKAWIEAFGWAWDASIEDVVKFESKTAIPEGFHGSIHRINTTGEMTAAYVVYEPFGLKKLNGARYGDFSFHHYILNRLLGSVVPRGRFKLTDELSLEEALERLQPGHNKANEHDFIAGLLDLPDRRLQGYGFVPLRGWDVPLNGVYLGRADLPQSKRLQWRDIICQSHEEGSSETPITVIAIPGESGHTYLRGAGGYRDDNESILGRYLIDEFSGGKLKFGAAEKPSYAACLVGASKRIMRDGFGGVVFIADQYTCLGLAHFLKTPAESNKLPAGIDEVYFLEDPDADPSTRQAPTFPLALVVPNGLFDPHNQTDAGKFANYLACLVNDVTYGFDWLGTANLYARQIIELAERYTYGSTGPAVPQPFELRDSITTKKFWLNICEQLKASGKPHQAKLADVLKKRLRSQFPHWPEFA